MTIWQTLTLMAFILAFWNHIWSLCRVWVRDSDFSLSACFYCIFSIIGTFVVGFVLLSYALPHIHIQ